jgi:hypothetical protein
MGHPQLFSGQKVKSPTSRKGREKWGTRLFSNGDKLRLQQLLHPVGYTNSEIPVGGVHCESTL